MYINSTRFAFGFDCDPFPGGHTWTLATVTGRLLREAEARFGPRDRSFTLLGVEFTSTDVPQTWFPGASDQVIIQLSDQARTEPHRACFQLAHEIIHLLAPISGGGAPVIEEGLATLFADEQAARYRWNIATGMRSYLDAKAAVSALLFLNPDAIRHIRSTRPGFRQFTPELLINAAPAFDPVLATYLCQPFIRAR